MLPVAVVVVQDLELLVVPAAVVDFHLLVILLQMQILAVLEMLMQQIQEVLLIQILRPVL